MLLLLVMVVVVLVLLINIPRFLITAICLPHPLVDHQMEIEKIMLMNMDLFIYLFYINKYKCHLIYISMSDDKKQQNENEQIKKIHKIEENK